MNPALIVMLIVILLLSVWVISVVMANRKKISCMTGMMAAMSLGMMVGLMTGSITGIVLTGNLMASTLISMMVGLIIGFFVGVSISLMAVLDGMLSGLMGGMMGAMLGDMIAMEHPNAFLKVMFVLFVCLIIVLLYMIHHELGKKNTWLGNPIITSVVLLFFFYSYEQLGNIVHVEGRQVLFEEEAEEHAHHGTNHPKMQFVQVHISADEFHFSPAVIQVKKGERVQFFFLNNGHEEHDFEITAALEGNKTIHLHAKPGEITSRTVVLEQAGTYQFVCTIPGHKEAGMHGTLIVS